jgi:UDP-glucose 4-epimerase
VTPDELRRFYSGKECLVTGGLGFIGSTLSIALAGMGAKVTVIDNMLPDHGGNPFNVEPVKEVVVINYGDILSEHAMAFLVSGKEIVFHLAGQVSHVLSMSNPFPDIEINVRGTLVLMEALKQHAPGATVVYTGTRGQYGASVKLPVSEDAPTNPKGIYELSNLTAEKILQVYAQNFGARTSLLRLTNIYGPRSQMKHSHFGVVNWFVRQLIDDKPLRVFGDGSIQRDFVYVDDAVQACLLAAAVPAARGEIINVGDDRPTTFLQLAGAMVRVAKEGAPSGANPRWEFAPFTPERLAQEPGHFYSDISKARRLLGWSPQTALDDGLRRTFDYYRQHRAHYWT